eukprot:1827557-Rhodomonas_salina.1
MCGTETAYGPTGLNAVCGTELAYAMRCAIAVLDSGTELAYAMRCAVLRSRMGEGRADVDCAHPRARPFSLSCP